MSTQAEEGIIKWDKVYVPNPAVCPGKTYSTFEEMKAEIWKELEAANNMAFAAGIPFVPYKSYHVPKPEFAEELKAVYKPLENPEDIFK